MIFSADQIQNLINRIKAAISKAAKPVAAELGLLMIKII